MDQNTNDENNEIEFGIHLNNLAEEAPSTNASGAEEDSGAKPPEAETTDMSETSDNPDVPTDPPQDENAPDHMTSALQGIEKQVEALSAAFESKIKYDEHKNKVIDDLHQSLQEYRDGLLKKYLQRIFTDVIKIVDDARKLAAYYHSQPHSEENSEKVLQYLEDMAQELEDMFAWEGVVAYNAPGDVLEPTRQRVVNKIETDDPLKDRTIAERLRPGYEWDGKIIRPEIVSIYICNPESTPDNKEL